MTVAIIILLSLLVVGTALYVHDHLTSDKTQESATTPSGLESECCGMHVICAKDSLLASVSDEIVYYDDEELDRFRGKQPNEYKDAETEEFRDILLTLLPSDVAGWSRSLQLRGINLPSDVREELLMIVSEGRSQNS